MKQTLHMMSYNMYFFGIIYLYFMITSATFDSYKQGFNIKRLYLFLVLVVNYFASMLVFMCNILHVANYINEKIVQLADT